MTQMDSLMSAYLAHMCELHATFYIDEYAKTVLFHFGPFTRNALRPRCQPCGWGVWSMVG